MTGVPRVFVYGTLLPGERYHRLIARLVTSRTPGVLAGACLADTGRGYPAAVEGPGAVSGEVLLFEPQAWDEALRIMDRLEGYVGPESPRNDYDRREGQILVASGAVRAVVYMKRDFPPQARRVLDGSWRRHRRGRYLVFVPGQETRESLGRPAGEGTLWPGGPSGHLYEGESRVRSLQGPCVSAPVRLVGGGMTTAVVRRGEEDLPPSPRRA